MRDPDRMEPLLKMLLEYWRKHGNTDQRLGQLLINLMRDAEHPGTNDAGPQLFNLEDGALFDMLDEMLDREDPAPPEPPAGTAGVGKIMTGSISAAKITTAHPAIAHLPKGWTPVPGTGGMTMHISPPGPDPSAIKKALGSARSATFEEKLERKLRRKMHRDGRA